MSTDIRYLGHLSDGSGVQRHSAGEHYPYVIAVIETDGGRSRCFEVIGPGVPALRFADHVDAVRAARRLATVTENEDSWSFEVEQAGYVSQQRQPQVIATVADWARVHLDGRHRYGDLTAAERAMTLLWYGRARAGMSTPFRSWTFADALAAAASSAATALRLAADPAALLPEKALIPAGRFSVEKAPIPAGRFSTPEVAA